MRREQVRDQDIPMPTKAFCFQQLRDVPRLTEEEEQRYMRRLVRGRVEKEQSQPNEWVLQLAQDARERLVEHFQWVVLTFARRLASRCRRIEALDLVQEGNIGLLRALDRYDPGSGQTLESFVAGHVRGKMLTALCEQNGGVRLDGAIYTLMQKVDMARQALLQELRRRPTDEEIAQRVGISRRKVLEVRQWEEVWFSKSVEGLLTTDEGSEIDEDRYCLSSVFEGSRDGQGSQQRRALLQEAIEVVLTKGEREALLLRHGLVEGESQGYTYPQIGALLGRSALAVQVAESTARRKLRAALSVSMASHS